MDPQTQDQPQIAGQQPPQQPDMVPQIASALTNGKNILVTVGTDPSVDELAAALGLTFLLGRLDKHVTAVFSGKIPPAIEFLDPKAIFENSVDSLRDFIIALDKEKADKLRYKVEDDVVKVFITPYRTVLSEKDLQFSQGDFNVDVVVALGVEKREELDNAITSHGRILHDATVVTINAGPGSSALGAIDWSDPEAGSVAEMLVTLSGQLGTDLLDEQTSTALLTGIVAETNRFSNDKTSPKVMTMAAQLMAAGANQQLIATNLRQEGMLSESVRTGSGQANQDNGEMLLKHDKEESKNSANGQSEKGSPKASEKNWNKKSTKNQNAKPGVKGDTRPTPNTNTSSFDNTKGKSETQKDRPVSSSGQQQSQPTNITSNSPVDPTPSATTPILKHNSTPPPIPDNALNTNTTTSQAQDSQSPDTDGVEASSGTLAHEEAAPAADTSAALEDARKAVEDAAVSQPFNPANQPLEAINAQPLPDTPDPLAPAAAPDTSASVIAGPSPVPSESTEPSPIDTFMQPQATPNQLNDSFKVDTAAPAAAPFSPPQPQSPGGANDAGLPPMPPMPPTGPDALPPMPPMPGQPGDPVTGMQPPINPGFAQNLTSQNAWTETGNEIAAKQAEKDAQRAQKMEDMTKQYDTAVDRNRELQGLPPVNDPKGSGLPPIPPIK